MSTLRTAARSWPKGISIHNLDKIENWIVFCDELGALTFVVECGTGKNDPSNAHNPDESLHCVVDDCQIGGWNFVHLDEWVGREWRDQQKRQYSYPDYIFCSLQALIKKFLIKLRFKQATGMTKISRGVFSKNFRPGGYTKNTPYPLFPLPGFKIGSEHGWLKGGYS